MSRVTKPDTEPNVTCGFFNGPDRLYDARTFSALISNLVTDGVFASIGDALVVIATSGLNLNVGSGKCWFNDTWMINESITPITCPAAEAQLNRIDAVIVRVNNTTAVRDVTLEVISGQPAGEPVRPTLANSGGVYEHALCYIYRKAGSTQITQSDITNVIGTDETPFVTGILQTISLDQLFSQWQDDLNRFRDSEKTKTDEFLSTQGARVEVFIDTQNHEYEEFTVAQERAFNEWYAGMQQLMADVVTEVDTWSDNFKSSVLAWFNGMKGQLSTDAAANLQFQINDAENRSYINCGFPVGTKTISEDGKTIVSTYNGMRLVKTFSDDFLTCDIKLYDEFGMLITSVQKRFSSDGLTIETIDNFDATLDM